MTNPIPQPFVYRAEVTSVYDGDSLRAMLDMGLSVRMKASCRLYGIDAPELRSRVPGEKEAAQKARDFVKGLIMGQAVVIESIEKPDKYGRLLVRVWTKDGVCVNDRLLEEGMARPYDGGEKISWAAWT
jgi:micrococcal nuclease